MITLRTQHVKVQTLADVLRMAIRQGVMLGEHGQVSPAEREVALSVLVEKLGISEDTLRSLVGVYVSPAKEDR